MLYFSIAILQTIYSKYTYGEFNLIKFLKKIDVSESFHHRIQSWARIHWYVAAQYSQFLVLYRGVMANVIRCVNIVNKFELQVQQNVLIWTNALKNI